MTFKDYLPARELAEHLSIGLLTPSMVDGLPEHHLDLLLRKDNSKWSGATFKCGEKHCIIYNQTHADVRIESTIMHEIAHILCEHKPSVPLHLNGMSVLLRDHNPEHEAEAEWLGGCLQLPREGLIWALKQGMTNKDIADNYKASLYYPHICHSHYPSLLPKEC